MSHLSEAKKLTSSACHCVNLRRAANAVTDYYDRAMVDLGVTVNQYSLLSNILAIQPCSVAELARHVRLDRTTLVRNLKVLRTAGWVEDDAAPGNRRSRTHLTPEGEAMAERAKARWAQAQAEVEACLGEEGMRGLTAALLALEQLNIENKSE